MERCGGAAAAIALRRERSGRPRGQHPVQSDVSGLRGPLPAYSALPRTPPTSAAIPSAVNPGPLGSAWVDGRQDGKLPALAINRPASENGAPAILPPECPAGGMLLTYVRLLHLCPQHVARRRARPAEAQTGGRPRRKGGARPRLRGP